VNSLDASQLNGLALFGTSSSKMMLDITALKSYEGDHFDRSLRMSTQILPWMETLG